MTGRIPFRVSPMLATLVHEPFHRPGWVYEEKYDGIRILAYKEGARVRLMSRNANDRTATYGDVADAVRALPPQTLLLDGEIVAFDRRGVSRFQLLQQGQIRTTYAVFDCLYLDGRDLRNEPLTTRRRALASALTDRDSLRLARRLAGDGRAAYRLAKRRGLEGLIAKDADAPYVEGRSGKWLKVKVRQEEEFVIGGYTAPSGARSRFGALLLGAYDGDGQLRYVGKVGTGFTQQSLDSLYRRFQPLIRETPPFAEAPPARGVTYLAPRLVAQIAFEEWTTDWKLRQPAFLGLRDDKKPKQVSLPEATR